MKERERIWKKERERERERKRGRGRLSFYEKPERQSFLSIIGAKKDLGNLPKNAITFKWLEIW